MEVKYLHEHLEESAHIRKKTSKYILVSLLCLTGYQQGRLIPLEIEQTVTKTNETRKSNSKWINSLKLY